MLAPGKKPPANQIEVLIRSGKEQRYVGAKAKLKPLLKSLEKYHFNLVSKTSDNESILWEDLARERIQRYTKPGLVLRGARLKEGLSQVELAAKLGITQYNVSKMENGKRPIGKKMAQRLGKILKINYRVFL